MNNNSKYILFSVMQSLCIICIIGISFMYAYSSFSPWNSNEYQILEPRISLDTKFYVLPQQIYQLDQQDELLIDKANDFHSGISTTFISSVFYRPDFANFPIRTGLILLFRIISYLSIASLLFILFQISRSVSNSKLFEDDTNQKIFFLGLILLYLPVIRTLHSIVLAGFIRLNPQLLGYEVGPNLNYLWLSMFGLLVISISFFFKEARVMYEEQKLTI